jgi:hypothetical protein
MKTLFTYTLFVVLSIQSIGQILPNFGGQRAGLSTLGFLKNDMNPRSVAMGGASVANSGDLFSTYTNPASVSEIEDLSFSASNYFIGAGANQGMIAAIIPAGSQSAFGITLNTLNSGAMEVRTEFQPMGTGQKTYANNISTGLTYSRLLSDQFSFGVSLKYIYEQLAEYQNHTAAVDIGFKYNTDFKDLSFAVVMQNFSGNSSLNGDHLEVDFNRSSTVSLDNYTVPNVFKLGVSLTPVEKGDHRLSTTFELNHPNDNAENFRLGAEYDYHELFQFRAGYKINVLGQTFPTFGFGITHHVGAHPFFIHYAVNPTNFIGVQHALGLGLSINKMERE